MSRPDRKQAGFTLLEMVVVLGVIGTLAAMAMPSILDGVWRQRQSSAAQGLASFVRGVRDLTRRSGVAHNMVFYSDPSSDLGRIEVWMGMNNRCRLTDWYYTLGDSDFAPVARFDMAQFNPFTAGEVPEPGGDVDVLAMRVNTLAFTDSSGARAVNPVPSAELLSGEVCFEPGGDVYFRSQVINNNSPDLVMDPQHQLIQFSIRRYQANSTTVTRGVDRHVILTPSGLARVRQ